MIVSSNPVITYLRFLREYFSVCDFYERTKQIKVYMYNMMLKDSAQRFGNFNCLRLITTSQISSFPSFSFISRDLAHYREQRLITAI